MELGRRRQATSCRFLMQEQGCLDDRRGDISDRRVEVHQVRLQHRPVNGYQILLRWHGGGEGAKVALQPRIDRERARFVVHGSDKVGILNELTKA